MPEYPPTAAAPKEQDPAAYAHTNPVARRRDGPSYSDQAAHSTVSNTGLGRDRVFRCFQGAGHTRCSDATNVPDRPDLYLLRNTAYVLVAIFQERYSQRFGGQAGWPPRAAPAAPALARAIHKAESSGHEGDFIGVRRSYGWGAGDYRVTLAPDGEPGKDSAWMSLWITDIESGDNLGRLAEVSGR